MFYLSTFYTNNHYIISISLFSVGQTCQDHFDASFSEQKIRRSSLLTFSPIHFPLFEDKHLRINLRRRNTTGQRCAINVSRRTYTLIWVSGLCGRQLQKLSYLKLRDFLFKSISNTNNSGRNISVAAKQREYFKKCIVIYAKQHNNFSRGHFIVLSHVSNLCEHQFKMRHRILKCFYCSWKFSECI